MRSKGLTPCARGALVVIFCSLFAVIPGVLHGQQDFLRGDSNGDRRLDIADGIFILNFLFSGGKVPPCVDAADVNDDATVDISDGVAILDYLFLGGKVPAAPGPTVPGLDPTPDALGCGPDTGVDLPVYEPPVEPPASPSPRAADGWKFDPPFIAARGGRLSSDDGEIILNRVDLVIPGRGLDFIWSRTYRSRRGNSSPLGTGWDYSCNLRLHGRGNDLVLQNGNGRRDLFKKQADGSFAAVGFFMEGRENADGTFTFTFTDGGTWTFHWNDLPAVQRGRIASISDRNGNTIKYDHVYQHNQTDLEFIRVRDTLDREVVVAFDAAGRVSSVTDFTGRRVSYKYYEAGEAGGSPGDLKSATGPAVTGTPIGNDFPDGRTETYTYSTGIADERLNHNLTSITDASGRTILTLVYSDALDRADPSFDRVLARVWGDPHLGQQDTLRYRGEKSSRGSTIQREIVNDRVGNVTENYYDSLGRKIRVVGFTGRSEPGAPVTPTENRPTGKLRPTDPDSFETSYGFNEDSLLTDVVFPEGNSIRNVYQRRLAPEASPRAAGLLREVHRLPGPRGGDQAELVETFEYEPLHNKLVHAVDAAGNATDIEYDANGNRVKVKFPWLPGPDKSVEDWAYTEHGQMATHLLPDNGSGHRRLDRFEYYSDGPQNGYLKSLTLNADDPGGSSVTTCEYDAAGRRVREIDPAGNSFDFTWNALDELVRLTMPPAGAAAAQRITQEFYRDARGNIVRMDLANLDEDGVPRANAQISTVYEYDALGRLVRKFEEVGRADLGPGDLDGSGLPLEQFVINEYSYDAVGDRVRTRFGEATSGHDPQNAVVVEYDERRLVKRIEFEVSAGVASPRISIDYDGNGLPARVDEGPEESPAIRLLRRDGLDRLIESTDPMGNVTVLHYDPRGLVVSRTLLGELEDVEGSAGNVALAEESYSYDERGYLTSETCEHYRYGPGGEKQPVGKGKSTTTYSYSDWTGIVLRTDDNGHSTHWTYDAMGRPQLITDAAGNQIEHQYDSRSNLIALIDRQSVAQDGSFREFRTEYEYDGLGRRVAARDPLGNTTRCGYDSKSNLTSLTDALGNITRYKQDCLDRLISTSRAITDDGTGAGKVVREIIQTYEWDRSSRLVAITDDNGNTTRCAYDFADRPIALTLPDGRVFRGFVYDEPHYEEHTSDANGTVTIRSFDKLHRLGHARIHPGGGVSSDTTFLDYRYDGLWRLVRAENDVSVATFEHDSLSNPVAESLNGKSTRYEHDGVGNLLSLTSPGGMVVRYEYDILDRVSRVLEGPGKPVAGIEYAGRMESLKSILQTQVRLQGKTSYDQGNRPSRTTWTVDATPPTVLDDHTYEWSPVDLKTARNNLVFSRDVHYDHDSLGRLIRSTASSAGTPQNPIDYLLDGVGNRLTVTGGPSPGDYLRDATLPEPADFQVDQYTRTPFDLRTYDQNGNVLSMESAGRIRVSNPDWADLSASVSDPSRQMDVHYFYDALGRRIGTALQLQGAVTQTRHYFAGALSIEDQDAAGLSTKYTMFLPDGTPCRVSAGDLDGDGRLDDHFLITDDIGNVVRVMDSTGVLPEATYEYGDFGEPHFFDAKGSPLPANPIDNPHLLAGMLYDGETGFYFDGGYYDPQAARGLSRGGSMGAPKTSFASKLRRGIIAVGAPDSDSAPGIDVMFNPKEYTVTKTTAMFNPKEYTIDKAVPWKHHDIQGLDAPTLEFTSGGEYKLQSGFIYATAPSSGTPRLAGGGGGHGGHGGGGGGGCGGLLRIGGAGWGSCFNCHPDGATASLENKGIIHRDLAARLLATTLSGPPIVGSCDPLLLDAREMTTGMDVEYRLYGPGPAHWGSASFTSAVTLGASKELQAWFNDAAHGKNIRKNISVTLFKSDKTPGRSYNLMDLFPTQWSAVDFDTSSTVQTEILRVILERAASPERRFSALRGDS